MNLVYTRDLLGHSDVSTTEVYARADEQFKRKAPELAYPSPTPTAETSSWQKDEVLLSWLKNLGKYYLYYIKSFDLLLLVLQAFRRGNFV